MPAIITVIALVIAVGGAGALVLLTRGGDDQPTAVGASVVDSTSTASSAATETSPESSSTTSESPTSPTDDAQAVRLLNQLADTDEKQVPLDDKYLISLSLKWVGVTDTTQQAEPFTARDIWNHFRSIIDDPKFRGEVKIVRDGHFGHQLAPDQAGRGRAWIALIDPDLPTQKAGFSWCEANFTERGEALNNLCYPRKASAPHD